MRGDSTETVVTWNVGNKLLPIVLTEGLESPWDILLDNRTIKT